MTLEQLRTFLAVIEHSGFARAARARPFLAVAGKEIGLGFVNPRTSEVEAPAAIVARVEQALEHVAPRSVFLNPDCGFGTFARRPVNEPGIAASKLAAVAEAARLLRDRYDAIG